ncbi:MAG TPA: hypothetical protein VM899_10520, partial [Rubellimicrobium sp.]|nr:hypothetical protein [Rubellimicrobium sp.]
VGFPPGSGGFSKASPSGEMSSHWLEGGDIAGLLAPLRRLQAREQRADGRRCRSPSATRPATTGSGCSAASPPRDRGRVREFGGKSSLVKIGHTTVQVETSE